MKEDIKDVLEELCDAEKEEHSTKSLRESALEEKNHSEGSATLQGRFLGPFMQRQ